MDEPGIHGDSCSNLVAFQLRLPVRRSTWDLTLHLLSCRNQFKVHLRGVQIECVTRRRGCGSRLPRDQMKCTHYTPKIFKLEMDPKLTASWLPDRRVWFEHAVIHLASGDETAKQWLRKSAKKFHTGAFSGGSLCCGTAIAGCMVNVTARGLRTN